MDKEDYYSILQVDRGASFEDIKRSYRRLAMKHHPDRNPDKLASEAKFKVINEAYEVLSNKEKRQAYDLHGHAGVNASSSAHAANSSGFSDIFDDIFGSVFGGGARSSRNSHTQKGSDIQYNVELSLEEAVKGCEVKIRIKTRVNCDFCHGSGAKNGAKPVKCKTCNGVGQVRLQQGFFSIEQTCHICHGRGEMIVSKCIHCYGDGLIKKNKNLSVKIPAGVDNGDKIRLAKEGECGVHNGPPGDLYVEININSHNIFQRDGIHLYCEVPISFVTAALGGEIEVPTLEGRLKLKIPSETQTGKLFRLREKGVCSVRGEGPGDLLCKVIVETPISLNKSQKILLEKLDKTMGCDYQIGRAHV